MRLRVREALRADADDSEGGSGSEEGQAGPDDDSSQDEGVSEERLLTDLKAVKDRAAAKVKRDQKKLKKKRMKAKARQLMGGETAVDFVEDMELFHLKNLRGDGAVDEMVEGEAQVRACAACPLQLSSRHCGFASLHVRHDTQQ